MEHRLKDRIAIITGGSSGIGRAIALLFAKNGAKVVIADLHSKGVETEITGQFGDNRARFISCNVAEEQQIKDLVDQTVEWGGRVDILCNVAGIMLETKYNMQARCHEMEAEDLDKTFTVNVRGAWLCSKYALKQMLAQPAREPNARGDRTRGWIVNLSSVAGVVGCATLPAYTPSKHAVAGMTRQMALDYAEDRIHINALGPGGIKTPMADFLLQSGGGDQFAKLHPWNAWGNPDDVASAALFLASDDASFVTGSILMVDGGYTTR